MTDETRQPGDQEELERLRAQVADLQAKLVTAQAAAAPASPKAHHARWRSVTATVLIVVACVLAPLSVVAIWANSLISDTDRYVQTVAPLARDPAIQSAVTDDITNKIFTEIDIKGLTDEALAALGKQGLPPKVTAQLSALATPIANGIESFTHNAVAKIVASPAFATAWDAANRAGHQQVVNVLSGKQGTALSSKNGTISLNLGPFVSQVKAKLVAQGFTIASKIPPVSATFTLFKSEKLTKAQGLYRLLDKVAVWLPILALVLIAVAVYIAKNHRRALIGAALGVVGGMLVLGVGLAVVRPIYLGSVPSNVLPHDAASAVFDTVVRFLRTGLRATAVAGLIVAAAAFLTGRSVTAVRTRAGLVHGVGWLRGGAESAGLRTGQFGTWVYEHKRWLRIGMVLLGALVIVFWGHPTPTLIIVVAILVLLGAAIVEFLGRPPVVTP